MKRETLINFLLSAVLAGVGGLAAMLNTLRDRQAEQGERLARIEAKIETIKPSSYAKIP